MPDVDIITSRAEFEKWIYAKIDGVVPYGPFKGMKMLLDLAWTEGALSPMLLGSHEAELHEAIEEEIARLTMVHRPKVVNVGCAEGYYAVGLARRLPHARVWVIDTDERALALAHDTATLNGVELISGEYLPQVFAAPDLVVMDCEGAEVEYLDPEKFPDLKDAHIIVEIHETTEQETGKILTQRWKDTHEIKLVVETGRNPNIYEFLRTESSLARWLAVCESRPCQMAWFVMNPKEKK